MMDHAARPIAPSLLLLCPLYGGMMVLAGFLGNKQADFGPLSVELGLSAYIVVLAISSVVAELHGRRLANLLAIAGFLPLLASMALIALGLALPPSQHMSAERIAAFDIVFAQSPRIMVAGIAAYLVSVLLNVRIFSWLRGRLARGGWWLMFSGGVAAGLAQIVDGLIFVCIAFYGVFPILPLLAGQVIAKVILSFTAVPLLIRFGVGIGRRFDREAKR